MPRAARFALAPFTLAFGLLALVACDGGSGTPDGATPTDDAGPRTDAGIRSDAGSRPDAGGADGGSIPPPRADTCAERSAALVAMTGPTLRVSPAGEGQVRVGDETRTLRQVVSSAAEGTTILLEDGTYVLPEASAGGYSGLYFTTPNVTLRGASGDPTAVILDSQYRGHGSGSAPITVAAPGVTLAHFTVRRSIYHLIHLWDGGDGAVIHGVHLVDGGQQFLKSSPGAGHVDDVEVSCSTFQMTPEGRDNVWGYGATDGATTCYTGGIDTHDARNWHVHDNAFEGIYCDADGAARPAHGRFPEERGGQTYRGGLAEHAIHMWDSEAGSGHVIERNHVVDCARGIGLGLRAEVYGTIIRNNMVFSRHAGSREHDVGIILERAHDSQVFNNTVFFSSPDAYPNAIEIRWGSTRDVQVRNNLTNRGIRLRDGASADQSDNLTDAEASWFVDATRGDLRLATCTGPAVGAGMPLSEVPDDIDGEPRGDDPVVGADHCEP